MPTEIIPTYPTLAFATRQDHLAWLAANAAKEAAQVDVPPPGELLSKDALKELKLTRTEVDAVCGMLFDPASVAGYTPAQKLSALWTLANTDEASHADFQAAVATVRG